MWLLHSRLDEVPGSSVWKQQKEITGVKDTTGPHTLAEGTHPPALQELGKSQKAAKDTAVDMKWGAVKHTRHFTAVAPSALAPDACLDLCASGRVLRGISIFLPVNTVNTESFRKLPSWVGSFLD